MGVHKEVWTGEVLKKFRALGEFLKAIPDRSALVKNKVIHLVDVGIDPAVLINNATYPIVPTVANDGDVAISLDRLDTVTTAIQDEYLYGLSFDAIAEYSDIHSASLQQTAYMRAIHAIAPASNTALTPVVATTGGSDDGTVALKKITIKDILSLKKLFDKNKVPAKDRCIVLCPEHVAQLLESNEQFEKQYMDVREGQVLKIHGFNVYEFPSNPIYNGSNAKKAYGATAAPSTDRYASIAFYAPRIFKAMDDMKMYYKEAEKNPENRSTDIGFRTWFICMPKKFDSQAAIVSVPV
jgi:hypothetical protein